MKEYLSERPGLIALLLALSIFVWIVSGIVFPTFFVVICGLIVTGAFLYIIGILCMAIGEEIAERLRR